MPRRLNWEGHGFLDSWRDQGRWDRAKRLVLKKSGTLTIEGLKIAFGVLPRNIQV